MDGNKAPLYAKLAAVMAEMSNIQKTGKNTHFDYKFVTADAVAEKVRQLLSERGVAFFAAIVGREMLEIQRSFTDKRTGEMQTSRSNRWVVDFEFTFADGESGVYEVRKWSAEADAADDKGINKCATAAEKYFLLKTFIVSTGDEPDADADGRRKQAQQRPPQQTGNKPAPNGKAPERPTPAEPPASTGIPPTPAMPPTAGVSSEPPLFPLVIEGAVVHPLNTEGDSAFPPLKELPIAATEGDATHLPRTKAGIPILGTLNIVALMQVAVNEKVVRGKDHFFNLMDVLYRDGDIRAASKPEAVLEAARKHEAAKDAAKETAGVGR